MVDAAPGEMPSDARCALHPERAAAATCARCGTFACEECRAARPSGHCLSCARRSGPDRLKWWHGALVLVVIGIGAQIAGAIAFVVAMVVDAIVRGVSLGDLGTSADIKLATIGPSLVVTGLVMGGGAALFPRLAGVPVGEALGLRRAPWPAFLAAPIGILALGPTSDALRRLMQTYAPGLTLGSLDQLDQVARSAPVWIVAPLFALVPGIAEELLFRGAFQRSIRTRGLAVVLSGLFFAVYHTDPHHIAAVLPLGLYLAWLGDRTGSVLVPITAHVANNGTAVIAAVLLGREAGDDGGIAAMGSDVWYVPLGLVIAGACVGVVHWVTRRPAAERTAVGREPAPVPEPVRVTDEPEGS